MGVDSHNADEHHDDETVVEVLSNDPELLKELLAKVWKENQQLRARLKLLEDSSRRRSARSAAVDEHQRYLFDELVQRQQEARRTQAEEEAAAQETKGGATKRESGEDDDPAPTPPSPGKPGRRRGKRAPLSGEQPRVIERHELPDDDPTRSCQCCNQLMQEVGVRKTQQLDYQPARLVVKEHHQVLYACTVNKCESVPARAPKPAQPIERGIPAVGLLAFVIVSRFADHLPYFRQTRMFARQGVAISRRSLSRWVYFAGDLLEPIVEHMAEAIFGSRSLHADDATFPVLVPGLGETHPAKIWAYVGDDSHPHTIYRLTERRLGEEPQDFLRSFEGFLHADAFSGYDRLYKNGKVCEVACWAHAKRKLDAAFEHDLRAGELLVLLSRMYEVEKRARDLDEQGRRAMRQAEVKPILAEIRALCDELAMVVRPKSSLAAALTYINNQWDALQRFADTGHLKPDNNTAERALRGVCLGRKNWLFGGSFAAAQRACTLISLVESCQRNDIDPFEYLVDVLDRVSTHPHSRIDELTPAGWKAAQQAERDVA